MLVAISLRICVVNALPVQAANGETDVRDSLVKIYTVQTEADYVNPWNMGSPSTITGSGCVIEGNRILTNAHVVSDQTFIQVRLHGRSEKHRAEVVAVSHEADLALLRVDDPSVLEGITPLQLGDLPEVQQDVVVYGFPEGGDTLSATEGVISRIEHQRYVHSRLDLLAVQLDAAVNAGNSGGPVLFRDRVVGVVMQTLIDADNIGYMVPGPVVERFLRDLKDGDYDGIPDLGLSWQSIENEALRKMYDLGSQQSGVLVTAVASEMPAATQIEEGDVIVSIDGHDVAGDGTVEFRPHERTSMDYYVQQHQIGDWIHVKLVRSGAHRSVWIELAKTLNDALLVPSERYDIRPRYYVYGGLVFSPLTMNYLKTWGEEWNRDAPDRLLHLRYYYRDTYTNEAVLLVKVLPSRGNAGYHDITDWHITEVNGQAVKDLPELIELVENSTEPLVVFGTEDGSVIALDREKAELESPENLEIYGIPTDRSEDLR